MEYVIAVIIVVGLLAVAYRKIWNKKDDNSGTGGGTGGGGGGGKPRPK